MGEKLIKPYEISVWEDRLTQIEGSDPAEYKFKETKLAVIGSDTMTGPNKIYNPVFHKKINGEKTLSFSLKYKYFDPYSENEDVVNPFAALLVNERKVKLHYDNEWYEFIIKDHTESSDGLEWTYTCNDAFVLELSKNGYNITFDTELNNNQGTAQELAKETLKNTDWQVGEDSDTLTQLIAEPLYKATLVSTTGINIINASNNGEQIPSVGQSIWLFYSYVKNQNGKNVQFIIRDEINRQYIIDSKNIITDTNFRITTDLEFKDNSFYYNDTLIISIGEVETHYQANRLAYNQLTTYDPVMKRTVNRFQTDDGLTEVYKYTDYEYTTSNVVMNFITNGENFNALEDGTLQGWNPYTDQENGAKVNKLELVTKPEIGTGKELVDINALSQIEGFLKFQPNGVKIEQGDRIYNTLFNSGINDSGRFIQTIASGQEFVFRWRAGEGQDVEDLEPKQSLGLIVAFYDQDDPVRYGYYYKHIDPKDVILKFEGTPQLLNNYVKGGSITTTEDGSTEVYVIDNVAQTPSTKYIYINETDKKEYIWNGKTGTFDELEESTKYLPYYYLTATANKPVANSILSNPTQKIGIFIYATEISKSVIEDPKTHEQKEVINPIFIQDIQLTRCVLDAEGKPVILGNVPTATSNPKDFYYIKPSSGMAAEDVETYISMSELKTRYNIDKEIKPLYNENSEKTLTISVSQSNCFNILQTIAETFECWVDLVVEHDDNGYITETEGKPNKFVYLREYVGKDNYAGFKYGINLDTIERTINSDEIVTKLIVDMSQSEYVDEGFVSIASAPSNQTGESYILNFDYFYNQNLLNRDEAEADRLKFIESVAKINADLQVKEKERRELEASLTAINSNRTVFNELVATAKDMRNEARDRFQSLTNMSYEDYQKEHGELIEDTSESKDEKKQLTDEETLVDVIGEIYATSATINNYSGVLSNVNKEYQNIRKQLKGSETFYVEVKVVIDNDEVRHIIVELNDYLPSFKFIIENDETVYESTVNKKFFDISPTDATTITFTAPTGYSIVSGPQPINDSETKEYEISPTDDQKGVEDEIEEIHQKKEELVNKFNNKYSRYIQEGTWNSTDYIDSELYYLDAWQVSNTSAQPAISYTINVVEISELEGYENFKFDVGDKTYVEDTEFFGWNIENNGTEENPDIFYTPAREEVIVAEIEWHLDEPDQNVITVQNYKTRFEDLFQRISATVQTVQYNEATYAKMSSLLDANGTINQNVLLQSLNNISGQLYNLTSDGSVLINGDHILVRNLNNAANRVIINSEGIRISSDGGQNWQTAIDGQGINIGTVYTGTLNTNNVVIGNENNPSFRWDKSGISAYKYDSEVYIRTSDTAIDPLKQYYIRDAITGKYIKVENPRVEDLDNYYEDTTAYDLQTYVRYDQYGLYGIKNNSTFKAQSLDDVIDNAHFAVTWDGFFIKNSYEGGGRVSLTSGNDFQVINTVQGQENEKIKIGALEWRDENGNITTDPEQGVGAPELYGIRIKNDAGAEVMKTDDEGNITITGTINANAGNIGGMSVDDDQLRMNHIILKPGVGIYSDYSTPIPFIISDTDGTATFNEITARGHIEAQTGTLGLLTVQDTITVGDNSHSGTIQSNGYTTGVSGWAIKSDGTAEFQNATVRGHIDANSGTLNNLSITGGITVDQNGYIQSNNFDLGNQTGWKITDSGATFNNVVARGHIEAATGTLGDLDVIDTITVGANGAIESSNYSLNDGWHIDNTQAVFNNARVRGEINAGSGNFYGIVTVGKDDSDVTKPYIVIDGARSIIKSSNYQDGAGYGWMIDSDGDATFNNITARGSIKTAVFEYAEIQAVGGIFIFRPSSTIRTAVISNNDIIFTVEKPYLFQVGDWCKVSNYLDENQTDDARINNILLTNGLTHVYQVIEANGRVIKLQGAAAMVQGEHAITDLASLSGGALIDMGNKANGDGEVGTSNYGIGINSSDNTVNLPRRAISLFETIVDETKEPKVKYQYRGILGTLPELAVSDVDDSIYNQQMAGTQGIYTDNMYIGDASQFVAFYEDNEGNKQLKIKASQILFEVPNPKPGQDPWQDIADIEAEGTPGPPGKDGEDAIVVRIESNIGNNFIFGNREAILSCYVIKGTDDITSTVNSFVWSKMDKEGNPVQGWSPKKQGIEDGLLKNQISIDTEDVDMKSIFSCNVSFD